MWSCVLCTHTCTCRNVIGERERVGGREGKEMCGKRYIEIRKEKEKGRELEGGDIGRGVCVCVREREGGEGQYKEGLTEEEGSVRRRLGRGGGGGAGGR